ncbi:MAG: glycosyltransferase family 2 protein [Pseudomonadota bacterium]|nr:glycosyltransferase family 2 protein [Pseudomonadota bacterium]
MATPAVLISILNWNNAGETIHCVASLLEEAKSPHADVRIRVIDNGSNASDYAALRAGAERLGFSIARLENNLGFTGGHNTSIDFAIAQDIDYIWMLNNDATVRPGCLDKLVAALEADRTLGAVSPVIEPEGNGRPIAAWGGTHDWVTRQTVWFTSADESRSKHAEMPGEIFVAGTAIMLRTRAMADIGGLDERLFAYYDDSDLGVRLAKKGWYSKVVFDATIEHGWREIEQMAPYFFYLYYRNEMIFLATHVPAPHRRLLWLKMVDQALFNAERFARQGMKVQADALLLGIWDFTRGRHGRPQLDRPVPGVLRLAAKLSNFVNRAQFAQQR